jgi:hypothetical protein
MGGSKCCSANAKCPFGAVQTITNVSAITLWALVAASAVYKAQDFGTPFKDSLTEEQKAIQKKSGKARAKVFRTAFAGSAAVIAAASLKLLRWN